MVETATLPDTLTNQIEQVKALAGQRRKRGRIQQRDQAATLQRLAYDAALALQRNCTNAESGALVIDTKAAKAIKDLLSAWDIAADRLRVLRGKGLPASVKGSPQAKQRTIQPIPDA